MVCLSAIFKYLCQRIYGDGSGYIKRTRKGGLVGKDSVGSRRSYSRGRANPSGFPHPAQMFPLLIS